MDVLKPKGSRLRRRRTARTSCWPTTPGRASSTCATAPTATSTSSTGTTSKPATTATRDIWDRTNGRIYKISYRGTKPVTVDLAKKSDKELVELLLHKNDWYVRHAQRLLQERAANKKLDAGHARRAGEDRLRAQGRDAAAARPVGAARHRRVDGGAHPAGAVERCRLRPGLDGAAGCWRMRKLSPNDRRQAGRDGAAGRSSPVVRLYLASAAQRAARHLERQASFARRLVR